MGFVQGVQRKQLVMFPESLDEYIGDDNPVRFIDAFVRSLDMQALGFKHAVPKETGRPPYHPGDLLRLYVYGYLNGVRSSRKLEREANRNVEVMWLLGKLTPDFKTIADFRRDNGQGIREACRQFTLLCRDLELFGGELVAIDGSKFKAVNSRERNFTRRKLRSKLRRIDDKIEQYLQDLDKFDEEEMDTYQPTAEELQAKIEALKKRRQDYQDMQDQMEDTGESQISLTDGDARSMFAGTGQAQTVGYNVQIAVDDKHKLIVDHEVVNEGVDSAQLGPMAVRAKEALQVEHLEVLADKGYYRSEEISRCVEEGIVPYVPKANTSSNSHSGLYGKQDFRYDPANDCYWCPAGCALAYRFESTKRGRIIRYYATQACKDCDLRRRCTRNRYGRRIWRWVDERVLDDMDERMRAQPEKVKRRKSIVEHPFGTIKHSMHQGHFLTRGLQNVRAEMSLTILAYNIKRVINLLGTRELMAARAA